MTTKQNLAEALVIERTFNAPVGRVWEALTEVKKMRHWYFDLKEFEPKVGFEFSFVGENEGRKFVHLCEITEVEVDKKLAYSWRYEGYGGKSFVTFELFSENDKTRVKLTHEGLETFPANNPDFAKENFAGGWTYIIGTSLKEFVEKTKVNAPA